MGQNCTFSVFLVVILLGFVALSSLESVFAQNPISHNAQQHKEEGKIYVLTKNELLILDGDKLVPLKKLDMTYSKMAWDNGHLYLAKMCDWTVLPFCNSEEAQKSDGCKSQQCRERVTNIANKVVVMDANFNEINSYKYNPIKATEYIMDFDVKDGTAYLLIGNELVLLDANTLTKIAALQFIESEKPSSSNHDIIVGGNYAYILDDVVYPLFLHVVDISDKHNLIEHTIRFSGVNYALPTQDLTHDKWYVEEVYGGMGGYGAMLDVIPATPQALTSETEGSSVLNRPFEQYSLFSCGYDLNTGIHIGDCGQSHALSSIKVNGSMVYGLRLQPTSKNEPYKEVYELAFSIFSLNPISRVAPQTSLPVPAPRINAFQQAVYAQIESGEVVGSKEFTEQFLGLRPTPAICTYSSNCGDFTEAPQSAGLLAIIDLNDTGSYSSNIVLVDNKAYVGGDKGVHVIDVSDPTNPVVSQFIETKSPVRYLLSR